MFNIRSLRKFILPLFALCSFNTNAQVIISQYYEGTGVNKWIELTNLGSSAVNTASPQLKLGLWSITGSAGTINITGAASQIVLLNVTIPARGSVLIGSPSNALEVSYLTAASAAQTSSTVINFNGNDGIALMDASNNIIDQFGQGISAIDISYTRNLSVAAASAAFVAAEWTSATLAAVDEAPFGNHVRLGYHLSTPCAYPLLQPTALNFTSFSSSVIQASFTAAPSADEYLVVQSSSPAFTDEPVDGIVYHAGDVIGTGTVISRSSTTSFSSTGLIAGNTYYYFIFSVNSNCVGGPLYLVNAPLTGSHATSSSACVTPAAQANSLNFGNTTTNSIAGSFTAASADEYLVVASTGNSLSALPADGTVYNAGNNLGGGIVVSRAASSSFTATGLNVFTNYYFFIFSINSNCSGGPKYLTANPLTGSKTTNDVSSGALNVYFGNLHAHSSYSDGNADDETKIPADNFAYAKNSMCMDFLGISDHNHVAAGMHLADWAPGRAQAAAATNASFVGLFGMEWGVISGGGHVIVYGMDSLLGWDAGQYQVYVPKNVYSGAGGLFDIVNRHGSKALAYLAHPNADDFNNVLSAGYSLATDEAIVGTAVESGPAFSTNATYTNPATPLSYLWYYQQMLAKGYHLGPTIDHDNHNMTFGRTAKTRLAILAPSLTENDLLDGMRRMRFYASQDCNARINFQVNSMPVGSVLNHPGPPVITVSCVTTAPVASIRVMYGVPGSGSIAGDLTIVPGGTLNYTDMSLANLNQRYYYLDITETDGTRIITSPIWYSRDDAVVLASPTISSFFAVNEADRVVLKWTTNNETAHEYFVIERSTDFGRSYTPVGSMNGKGYSTYMNSYALNDLQPFAGVAYYRLVQHKANGDTYFSDTRITDRGSKTQTYFSIYPNPVQGILTIKAMAALQENTVIELFDMSGRRIVAQDAKLVTGGQQIAFNMSNCSRGTYLLKIRAGNKLFTQLVNKL